MTTDTSACTTLDAQLCFALHDASRAISASYRKGLAPLGLTYSQYVVLLVLWEHGPVTMGTLCRELHLDSGTLSPLLQRLEERGRVVRRRRPEDERTVEVSCTPDGQALREPVMAVQRRVQAETGLPIEDLVRLRGELQALADRLRTADESGVTGGE
ncbi:MarR family winged helix-turn-helix transcriptional regulator [Actinomycetospora chibensis]|jgi:MarR family transcriptional regulator, organic hydroperoxide resistance regulator|uniref:MarR family winged helix-turn-helix transcriptional regulator n=1 Tax=Actinomycetospora chibensis TaxID=663606 RepID=A0ABV9RIB0_9PSEU|nr:MarR family transcriptional regulator [Actinomycetospora chibensis]MDD7924578.1 MarR family transcriptional regulator [Actinomycetospora chibensis]